MALSSMSGASKMWPQSGQRNLVRPRNIIVVLLLGLSFIFRLIPDEIYP